MASTQLSWDELPAEEDLAAVTFVIVDLETTGGSPSTSAITEIGAVKVKGGEVLGEFATFVNPGEVIPAHIQALTGITDAMVRDAPSAAGAVSAFGEFAQDAVLVAHNAPFDLGFLKAACARHDLTWFPRRSLDTARLARVALQPGEVRNCKLSTLASYFHSPVAPEHRALADARATTHVLHRLLERVGSYGIFTWADLRSFVSRVSNEQRAKRHLANALPTGPGVYTFVDRQGNALYIGTSRNVRARVRSYFTATENRARMAEMIAIAERVDAIPCATSLEAQVRELRAIAEQQPHYNRRSRRAATSWWLRLTQEPAPRLLAVRAESSRMETDLWGPFPSRGAARSAAETIANATGLRDCALRIARNPNSTTPQCLRGHLGGCAAPCSRAVDRDAYRAAVDRVRSIIVGDLTVLLDDAWERMQACVVDERFEEAGHIRDDASLIVTTSERFHRIRALMDAQVVAAAAPDGAGGWDIHVIDGGRLVAAAHASAKEDARATARAALATAEDSSSITTATTFEEVGLLARWLETPGVRLIHTQQPLCWPVASSSRAFVRIRNTDVTENTSSRRESVRPVGPAPGTPRVSRIVTQAG